MTDAGPRRLGHLRGRGAELEVSPASDGVCAEGLVHVGGSPAAADPLARLHPEVSQ